MSVDFSDVYGNQLLGQWVHYEIFHRSFNLFLESASESWLELNIDQKDWDSIIGFRHLQSLHKSIRTCLSSCLKWHQQAILE